MQNSKKNVKTGCRNYNSEGKLKINTFVGIALALTISVVATLGPLAQAQTYVPLKITTANLLLLSSFPSYAYNSGKLYWYSGVKLDATRERCWNTYFTQHADNWGNNYGQCVSSIKALTKNNLPTSCWIKGSRVIGGLVPAGTAIATFDNFGHYLGHCAIFNSYIQGGFTVYDQNWHTVNGMGVFGKHPICCKGTGGVTDAYSYYVVLIPQ